MRAFEYLRDKNIKTVLDCGANVGYFTDLILEKLNPDKVFSVEPDSENFYILLENFKNNAKVTCINKAIFYGSSIVGVLGVGDNSQGGYMIKEVENKHKEMYPIVYEYTGKKFECVEFESLGIDAVDLTKIDVEGSEYNIIENSNKIKESRYLIIEWHNHVRNFLDVFIQSNLKNYKTIILTTEGFENDYNHFSLFEKLI